MKFMKLAVFIGKESEEHDFRVKGLLETLKSYPFTAVWQKYCQECGVPTGYDWMKEVKDYEKEVLSKR